jgi:hypothetical protein
MIEVFLDLARLEALALDCRLDGSFLHGLLEQHVEEEIHRLGLDHERPRRFGLRGVEMLVHAIVVHDGDIAGLPVVTRAVVDLVAFAVENIEGSFVDVAMLLRRGAGRISLEP